MISEEKLRVLMIRHKLYTSLILVLVYYIALLDLQLIYCTRKISRIKIGSLYKKIKFRLLKNYATDTHKNALRKINFPNYEYSEDVNGGCSDFFQKLMTVIDNIAPCNTKRVKGNTQSWFDRKVN